MGDDRGGMRHGPGGRRRRVALLFTAVLLLTAACGGKDASSKPAAQPGAGTSAGTTEGAVAGASAAAATRAAEVARAVATAQATAAAQAQPSAADPCRIVTSQELEAALGFPLSPGGRGTDAIGAAQCAYRAQLDQTPGTMPNVTVAIYRSRLARTTYEGVREGASSRATDVPGLGDKAYVVIGNGGFSGTDFREITVLRGDVLLSINVTAILRPAVSMSEEEKRAKLITLARTALGRL